MGVARWVQAYEEHAAWQVLENLKVNLNSREASDADEQDYLDRVRMAVAQLDELRAHPSVLVSTSALVSLQNSLSQVLSQVQQWAAGAGTPPLAQAATSQLDPVLDVLRGWPNAKDRYAKGTIAALSAFSEGADAELARVRDQVAEISASVDAVEKNGQAAQATFAADLAKLQEQATAAQAAVERQTSRLDSALNELQGTFAAAESERAKEHQARLSDLSERIAKALDTADAQLAESTQSQEDAARESLVRLRGYEDQAKTLVDVIGVAGTATEYGKYAQQERRTANIWRRVAVGLFVAAFALFLVALLHVPPNGTTPWQVIVTRLGGSVALLAAGAYAARESSAHRREERRAKETQLILHALDPFIVNLSAEERESIKASTARALFSRAPMPLAEVADGPSREEPANGLMAIRLFELLRPYLKQ